MPTYPRQILQSSKKIEHKRFPYIKNGHLKMSKMRFQNTFEKKIPRFSSFFSVPFFQLTGSEKIFQYL